MKLTIVLLTGAFLNVCAKTVSQTITYSAKNTPLLEVFSAIKKQTGFAVVYNVEVLNKAGTVSIEAVNLPLEDFLRRVFQQQLLKYSIKNTTIFVSVLQPASEGFKGSVRSVSPLFPPVEIKGRIVNEKGDPLVGVSVVVKGTSIGTVSNQLGEFLIKVRDENVTLIFSSTGYLPQEMKAGSQREMTVVLALDDKQLSEVVVTAFGVERSKRSLSYATQVVDGTKLTEARESNVVNSLKGQVAGVHINPSAAGPAGSSFVVIRGNSSLTGNNQPLYVVDGVPIDNQTLGTPNIFAGQRDFGDGIGNINPDDIENVSVLKGPAAAALYGARGAHGVILITSKKGKSGRINVDVNSNATFDMLNVTPNFQNVWGGGYDDNYTSFDNAVIDGQTVSQWPSWLLDNWGGKYDGRLISIAAWPELGLIPYTAKTGNNFKNFYRTGSTLTNTIGISGGGEKSNYRISVSDMHNKGIVPNNELKRQTFNLLTTFKISKKLTVEAKVNYIRQHEINPPETGGLSTSATVALNRMPLFLDLDWMKNYKRADGTQINYKSGSPANPYWLLNEVIADGYRDRLIGYMLARYQLTDWLTLQGRTGTDFYNDKRKSRVGINTPGTSEGSLTNEDYSVREDNSDLLLTGTGNLSPKITGSFSLGANHLDRKYERLAVNGSGFYIPGLYSISNAKLVTSSNYSTHRQMNSAYFSGQVGYENYLFLEVTGRNDWSSTLGKNNYSFFYPSVSTSFIFTDALELSSPVLSYGKIRTSYAEAGNDASPYQTQSGYAISTSNFNGQPIATIDGDIPLSDLKNELTRSYEFGTELRFFDNKLNFDITYYNASTINQITPVQISAGTGYASRLINAGEIRNQGVEIVVQASPVRTKAFKWDAVLNFSRNKSKVVSLAPGLSTLMLLDISRAAIEARPGQAYGNIVGLPFMRNEEGQVVLTDQGKWQPASDQVVLGNIQPDWLGGITNTFTYKGFELSALVDIRVGGEVYSFTKYNQMAGGTGKFTENRDNLIADGVILQSDGKYVKSDKVIPAQDYYALMGPWSGIGESLVIDASYVALREMRLGYNFGSVPLLKNTFLKTAKLSVVGRNLLYIYRDPEFKTMGVSPETAFNTTAAAQGVEMEGIPTTRNIGFNLSFSF